MKRLFLLVMAAVALTGCTRKGQGPNSSSANGEQVANTSNENGAAALPQSGETEGASRASVTYLTTATFRRVIADDRAQRWAYKGNRPAVVDFYAEWCGPCKSMSPVMAQVAQAHAGAIDFYKVDIDKEPELAAAFGISSIPAFLIIPVSGTPTLLTGAMPRADFEKAVVERSEAK